MSQINIKQVLKTYDGKDITEQKNEKVTNDKGEEVVDINGNPKYKLVDDPLTLRTLIHAAVQRPLTEVDPTTKQEKQKQFTAEEQAKIHQLCLKLFEKNEVSFTSSEKSYIEAKVSKIGNPLYYGRVLEIFGDLPGANITESDVKSVTPKEEPKVEENKN